MQQLSYAIRAKNVEFWHNRLPYEVAFNALPPIWIELIVTSYSSYVNNDKGNVGENGTIHIFSVATGRLYERMLRSVYLI